MLYLEPQADHLGMRPRIRVSRFGGVQGLEGEDGKGEAPGISSDPRRLVRLSLLIAFIFPPRTQGFLRNNRTNPQYWVHILHVKNHRDSRSIETT